MARLQTYQDTAVHITDTTDKKTISQNAHGNSVEDYVPQFCPMWKRGNN